MMWQRDSWVKCLFAIFVILAEKMYKITNMSVKN